MPPIADCFKMLSYAASIMVSCGFAAPLVACTLCVNFPDKTDVDFLLESNCAVLARPTAENPFTYSVNTTLKGGFDGGGINLLVDSMTRRQLAVHPQLSVLLVQPVEGNQWRSLGIVSKDYLPVVKRILMVAETWNGKEGRERRWQFFLPLFDHDDPSIRQLAYLELGRAPYATVRRLGRSVPRDVYDGILKDPKYLKWRSLAILLLAQSESPEDHSTIGDSLHAAERLGLTTNLSAWAAAAIEIDGREALQFIVEKYVRNSEKKAEELDAILAALSMHGGSADTETQDQIVALYHELLMRRPEFAARVADDLLAWQRKDLSVQLSKILEQSTSLPPDARRSIARYLRSTTRK